MSIKRLGDRGSPCLIPLLRVKVYVSFPLTSTEKETERTQFITQPHQSPSNTNLLKVASKKSHSTLSYAFDMSHFRAIQPPPTCLKFFM